MTQDQCLTTPTHFTYLGVCYVGNPTMTLSSPDNPQPVMMTATATAVPEPSAWLLMLLGAAFLYRTKSRPAAPSA